MIEFIATLGGILGIIVSLQLDVLPAEAKAVYSAFIVLFIVFAFLAYSAVTTSMDEMRIRYFIRVLSAAFSALLTVPLSIALLDTSAGIVIQSFPYVGVLAAVIAYLVIIITFAEIVYHQITKAVIFAFEKTAPTQTENNRPTRG